ncbi:MAG: RelA/SpoT family protein [Patescibacteria group bacterium]|nr:RelA/SpoT family protein [Patescibacteria group bacterium]MCL5262105.1 RelA/SpoT family protein [Patescibacteria group bacterium]
MDVKKEALENRASLISRAYFFAESRHKSQKRASGEPYFNHCLKTSQALADWNLDEKTIAAGLLHDVVEDTGCSLEDIDKNFGPEILSLVDGVTKLGHIKYRGDERQKDNIKKLILASSKDLRVIFVKLADRLHNMQTLKSLPPEKQKRVSLETYEIYSSLAYRLGMQRLAGELEDLAFPYLYPEEYKWLVSNTKTRYAEREKYLKRIKPIVIKELTLANVKPIKVDFRAKRYSSLYKKLLRFDMDIDKIYDLIAFRIIVENVRDCYAALGVVHKLWPPLPGRIKDYIAMPKPNGYRSLHTVVFCVGQKIVEFQIRTLEMHEEAENGVAAHWAYEESKSGAKKRVSFAKSQDISWVERLRAWQEEEADSESFLDALKVDFFKDRIFAITPKGRVVDLPAGATPIDFAYQIHTDLGDQCVGAKVNGRIVPLNHELRSSDIVEIIVHKGKKPSISWLEFVKTSSAVSRIKKALKDKGPLFEPRQTELRVVAANRPDFIKDLTNVVNRNHLNVVNLTTTPAGSGFQSVKIKCDSSDRHKISQLIVKIKSLKDVKEIDYRFV